MLGRSPFDLRESMAGPPARRRRRWSWRFPPAAAADGRRLIPALAMAIAASATLVTCALLHPFSLFLTSLTPPHIALENVAAAMPQASPLPPPPPPSPAPVEPWLTQEQGIVSASPLELSPPIVQPQPDMAPPRNVTSETETGSSTAKQSVDGRPRPSRKVTSERSPPTAKQSVEGPRPPRQERLPLWSTLPPEEALAYAKSEIVRAPPVTDDPELYAPLFRNASAFKRSYELMEKILKVYVYKDGPRPIFHTPPLKGIYASEGWFMKLMEENRQFAARDPERAHLFYMPYSSRQLQEALYVRDSHDMRPLSLFLKDYVNSIAAKYPFWNRTHGSDHFLVACHDWGPYITTSHDELCRNTIKALCNADASEGIFARGRDVSLPETSIRIPKRPLKFLGGKPVSQRPILAFFAGQMHGRVRPVLLQHWGSGRDDDMRIYGPLPHRVSRTMSYIAHMKSSRFCLCPMGFEVNSPRIVEAIYYECVPVIIADNFVPPLDEVLDWSSFSVVVAEKDIPDLKSILQKISLRKYISMQTNVKRLQKHFLWHAKPVKYDLFHMILHSIWFNRLNQVDVQR